MGVALLKGFCELRQRLGCPLAAKTSGGSNGSSDTTTKDNGKTVQSGKTFDGGIALYVGLSVLSATGSALVITKKKRG